MENRTPRIVWITGASSGIGSALALKFAKCGDYVMLSSRTKNKLDIIKNKISADGGKSEAVVCDVQSEFSVKEAVQQIHSHHPQIDILINNAGVTYFKDFADTTIDEFDHVINTNLRGVFLTTEAVLPTMIRKKSGLILNVISYTVKEVYTKSAVYTASKAGVDAMMKVLRAEVRRDGINIVNIFPGAVATPIWLPRQIEKYGNQMLLPEQVAEMIFQISVQPPELMVEEITIRPQTGDLK